ncbi:DUF488 domain-containing protein [bacterium]|nr:DUF488 domain-containing protein [bacterium]
MAAIAPQPRRLLTIGYEGKTIKEFLGELIAGAVETLLDVRELPLSRKRGFSKRALAAALADAGIDYVHLRALGSPRDVRRKLYADGDYDAFFDAYGHHLAKQNDAIDDALSLLDRGSVCLMCFEASHEKCHRSLVAISLEGRSEGHVEVVHR